METFERFARRLADIEAEVKDPPPLGVAGAGTAIGLRPSVRSISRALAVATVVVVAAAVIPFIAGGRTSPPISSSQVGLGGSISPSPASPSPTPTGQGLPPLDPARPPEEPSGPCINQVTVFDRMRTTIEQDASRSIAVVIGTITGVGKAQWNTPDGRPRGGSDLVASRVLRLLRVDVETVAKGSTPKVITVWIPGGLIGCHGFFIGDFGDPRVGSRYVFFLGGSAPSARLDGVTGAWQMWFVEDDLVQTSFDGRVPLATLITRVSSSP
jgi:hypothetical protein